MVVLSIFIERDRETPIETRFKTPVLVSPGSVTDQLDELEFDSTRSQLSKILLTFWGPSTRWGSDRRHQELMHLLFSFPPIPSSVVPGRQLIHYSGDPTYLHSNRVTYHMDTVWYH